MPHCSSVKEIYPTDLCFLSIPLCPPHLATHIPMGRLFLSFQKLDEHLEIKKIRCEVPLISAGPSTFFKKIVVIWKAAAEYTRYVSHHEDQEEKTH